MNGIRDTMKITNAMYLIASSKLQKVRKHVAQVDAYFEAVRDTIGDVLACMPELDHPYLEAKDARQAAERKKNGHRHAYLIVTADKGLAGAYNLNVLKKAEEELKQHPGSRLFVVGQWDCIISRKNRWICGIISSILPRIPACQEPGVLRWICWRNSRQGRSRRSMSSIHI